MKYINVIKLNWTIYINLDILNLHIGYHCDLNINYILLNFKIRKFYHLDFIKCFIPYDFMLFKSIINNELPNINI